MHGAEEIDADYRSGRGVDSTDLVRMGWVDDWYGRN